MAKKMFMWNISYPQKQTINLERRKTMNGHKTETLIVEPKEYQKEIKYSTIGHICDIQSDKKEGNFYECERTY